QFSDSEDGMELKTTHVGKVLTIERYLSIPEVGPESIVCCAKAHDTAKSLGLSIEGPWHFISFGIPRDTKTQFQVKFCLPVSGTSNELQSQDIKFEFLGPFYCASRSFQGNLNQLFELGYKPLVEEINNLNSTYTGESREVYHAWEGPESESNIVEIQFGLFRE
ncbi:TPA: hypothetical protein ACGFXT_003509, partial [Vibrio cholerae]